MKLCTYLYLLPTTNLEVGSGICVYACRTYEQRSTTTVNGTTLNLEICFGSPRLQTWRWCAQSGLRCLICRPDAPHGRGCPQRPTPPDPPSCGLGVASVGLDGISAHMSLRQLPLEELEPRGRVVEDSIVRDLHLAPSRRVDRDARARVATKTRIKREIW